MTIDPVLMCAHCGKPTLHLFVETRTHRPIPKDGLFDDLAEAFAVKLPTGLGAGTHTLAVRASDAADNVGASQVTFRVK